MSLPNMTRAFGNWVKTVSFQTVTKTPVAGEVQETASDPIEFDGVLTPVPERALLVKPEGQRKWMWWQLWTTQDLQLDDKVTDSEGREFRVMRKSDWGQAGFRQYQLTEGPTP